MPSLDSELARLQRDNRTLRAALLLTLLSLVTCGSGVTSNFARVNTNSLVIVTNDDRPAISLSANGKITFADAEGPVVLDAKTLRTLLDAAKPATKAPAP